MKKIISIAVVASFVFGLASFAVMAQEEATTTNSGVKANAGEEMEKILSPDMIRYYKNIKKEGASLYGIKKDKMVEKKGAITEKKAEKKLEKISHPNFIKLYEEIKKIGSALWGVKKDNKEKAKHIVTAEESGCVISAIEAKDAALIANNTGFTEKLNIAITTRTACQKTALGSTENQADNIEVCLKSFKESTKKAKEETNKTHKEIWKTYQESLKACVNSSAPADNTATSTEDGISASIESSTNVSAENVSSDSDEEITVEDGGGSITDVVSAEE